MTCTEASEDCLGPAVWFYLVFGSNLGSNGLEFKALCLHHHAIWSSAPRLCHKLALDEAVVYGIMAR